MASSPRIDYARITKIKRELYEMGCVVIVWTADDVPGNVAAAHRQEFLDSCADAIEDTCTQRGNEIIEDRAEGILDDRD